MTVAWISFFPVEWLHDIPPHLRELPREHPATWQRVLLAELETNPTIRLHVVALRKQFLKSETFVRNGVAFHLVKAIGGLRAPTLFWSDTWQIRRVLKSIQPDIVHAWGTEKGAGLVASRLGYPYLLTMQGLLTWLATLVPMDAYTRFAALLEKLSLRRASTVTVESSFGADYLHQFYPHLDLFQVEHAPLPLFHRVVRAPQTKPFRFLYVGAFSRAKGADVLLAALDSLKDELLFELIVVGHVNPDEVKRFKAQASTILWRRIQFRGSRTSEEIAGELAMATLLLYPTRCDNSPNAVKEAVVAGVPVVASSIGGIVDYVWPGRNGYVFPPGDADAGGAAIRQACSHPLFSLGLVETATLNKLRAYLSAQAMGQRFVELYGLVGSRQRGAKKLT